MAALPALPHRVTFLAPILTLPRGKEHLEQPAALLLFIAMFEHLSRHARVTVTDPDDNRLVDGDDRLITINHPSIDRIRADEYGGSRRDEILWLELSLDSARPGPVKFKAERFDGRTREFASIGQGALGAQIDSCIGQWLASLALPAAPRPLEAFSVDDLLNATACGYDAIKNRAPDGGLKFTVPPRLKVPFFRFLYVSCNLYTYSEILALEPDNPWAARDRFIDGLHNNGPTTRDPIRAALKTAPMFGKLYLSMFGEGVSDEEKLNAFAMASVLIPGNPYSLKDYGYALDNSGRWPEASRQAERACRAMPLMLPSHILAMDVYDLCRLGVSLQTAQHHVGFLNDLVTRGRIEPGDPDLRHCHLRLADTLMRAGRFEEAIDLRTEALRGMEGNWPNQMKVLDKWRTDPAMLAQLYAREASLRGDPGRVVEGFSAAAPDGSTEVAMLIEALLALGKDDLAALAFAHQSRTQWVINPISRLAGAKALAAVGRTADALESVYKVALSFPHTGWDTALNRVLRLLAVRPAGEWEAVVQTHLAAGARRLAKLVARDAADFVPGLENNRVVAQALAGSTRFGFDPSFLAPLRASLEPFGLADIEVLFAKWSQPSLEHADRLANEWPALVPEEPARGAPEGAALARACKILWGFAGAFIRYLALTTQSPNVLAGGYRQVASDALELLGSARGVLPRLATRQLLESIERVAGAVDPWLLDSWILRIERAFDIEANEGGHIAPLVEGLPWMTWLLRGDERIGYELKLGIEALGDPARANEALMLLDRSVRAIGRGAAPKWSTAAAACLAPEEALDVHLTATFANSGFAGPSLEAAKLLLPMGRGKAAFDGLCTNLPGAGKQWRDKQVAALAPLWARAQMACPIDVNQCFQTGMAALQQGNFDLAVECHRWCLANDPNNAQAWKNLGIAYARKGMEHEALAAFARADRGEAPKWAGQALRDAKQYAKATLVFRYASLWFTSADEWIALAASASQADDAETAAHAYGRAVALNPQVATNNVLHQWADALGEIGDYEKCHEVAQRLLAAARGDAIYTTCGLGHLATALLGLRRFQEAGQYAEQALAQTTYPENRPAYAEKLERARRGDPPAPKPSRHATPEGRAWSLIADGDFKTVLGQSAETWKGRRAMLTAAEFRYESENEVSVAPRANEAAIAMLNATAGQTDIDATLTRLQALRIRENAAFAVDAPCVMGARVPREHFQRLFSQRRSGGSSQQSGTADDPLVFPGQRVARLSDYVRIMKGMQTGNAMAALQAAGLDMATYGQVSMAWGQKIQQDPSLANLFRKMMHG